GNVPREQAQHCLPSKSPEDTRNPRTGLRAIDNFENFLRFLAPPGRAPMDSAAIRGERVFADIGCSLCHVPQLETGSNPNPAFNRKQVPLFSDLLLHDIGTGDGIGQADARGEEIRTPALWGLRFRLRGISDRWISGGAAEARPIIRVL